MTKAVILIGHGAKPKDLDKALLKEKHNLKAERLRLDPQNMSKREIEVDRMIRDWPRNSSNDPYYAGLTTLSKELKKQNPHLRIEMAFNESCSPDPWQVIEIFSKENIDEVFILSTMVTPGGNHSEKDLPKLISKAKEKYPNIKFNYIWPYKMDLLAELFTKHLTLNL